MASFKQAQVFKEKYADEVSGFDIGDILEIWENHSWKEGSSNWAEPSSPEEVRQVFDNARGGDTKKSDNELRSKIKEVIKEHFGDYDTFSDKENLDECLDEIIEAVGEHVE